MQFSPSFLDEIRERLRPSQVLGKDLRLIAKGRGEFMALCPFHKEKSPSFSISDDKRFYHCFGCGVHGDVIRFRMEYHKQSFPDAVTQLAAEAGLPMPKPETVEQKQARERKDILKELMEWAAQFYQQQLSAPEGVGALQYVRRRQLSDAIVQEFRLGYAPESRSALRQHLLQKGGMVADMVEAGLLIQPEEGEAYDRFRGRLMFPIQNVKGEVIAFGGRALKEEQQPKYLNSPETPLFHKGHQLYHYHKARQVAAKEKQLIVVEGYMDVIAFARAGIYSAVAPLGTALTAEQLQLCWEQSPEPLLCMDGDAAGQRALARAALLALPLLKPGYSLTAVVLPGGKDPDDLLAQGGAEALKNAIARPEPLAELLWRLEQARIAPRTPEQKAALEQAMLEHVGRIEDKTVREHYRQFVQDKCWALKRGKKSEASAQPAVRLPQRLPLPKQQQWEAGLVGLLVDCPELLGDEQVAEQAFLLDYQDARLLPLLTALQETLESLDFWALSLEAQAATAESLPARLAETGHAATLSALKAQRFLDKSRLRSAKTVALAAWHYLVAAIQTEQITGEYEQAVREWWTSDPERVEAFRQQKQQLEADCLKIRKHLETLLES